MASTASPFIGPAAAQAMANLRRPRMPADVEFAMFRDPDDARAKPLVFAGLDSLVRHLDRARDGKAIEMEDRPLRFRNVEKPCHGVSVWTQEDGQRRRFLGWYYLRGGSWRVLFATLPQGPVGARLRHARAA